MIFGIFIPFLKCPWNFVYLQKKHQLDSLNISEVIDSEKYSYWNAKKQLFQNNLWESAHSRIPNTTQICIAALLSEFSINPRQIDVETIALNEIENLKTVNTLMANNMYSPHNWEKFRQQRQTYMYQKGKIIFGIFDCIFEISMKFSLFR